MSDLKPHTWADEFREQVLDCDEVIVRRGSFSTHFQRGTVIDALNARPEPSVAEAARVLMQNKKARDDAFAAMWQVSDMHSLEATNEAGARYSITGDVINEMWYAALRALTMTRNRSENHED